MFRGCSKLKELDLSGITTGPVSHMQYAFWGCTSLKTIYTSYSWTVINLDYSDGMFGECTSLVGGAGTKYDPNHTDHKYARIDGGTSNPGYFTYKAAQKKGDVNGDNVVNVADIGNIIDVMSRGGSDAAADVNGDGVVNVADIGAIIDMMAANARQE